jgi:hypothetical protein
MKILIGNTFPITLIRRPAKIIVDGYFANDSTGKVKKDPKIRFGIKDYVYESRDEIASFWGHSNTVKAASDFLGVDLTPKTERPVLKLSANSLIEFDGVEYSEVIICSPDYVENFRPAVGEEVGPDKIKGWQLLIVNFPEMEEGE